MAGAHRHDLGQDAQGDLFGLAPAQVEADRPMQAGDVGFGKAGLLQPRSAQLLRPFAPQAFWQKPSSGRQQTLIAPETCSMDGS